MSDSILQVNQIKDKGGNATGITVADTTANVTLKDGANLGSNPTVTLGSNATFPTKVTDRTIWYRFEKDNATNQSLSNYTITGSLDFTRAYVNGCAPTGFTSVLAIEAWFLSGPDPQGYSGFEVDWSIASDGAGYNEHTGSFTKTTSGNFGANKARKIDLYNGNNNGSDFEDVIAEGDVFGFHIKAPSMNNPIYGLGIKINWRF